MMSSIENVHDVLIITGACGVGKSTIAKRWARHKQGAVVECDFFTEWIFNDKFERFNLEEELFVADLAFATAREYLLQGMPVAIENVWSPTGLEKLRDLFKEEYDSINLSCVWLKCEIDENHRRDELRIAENQMKERVDIVNDELAGYNWPADLLIIDSTFLSIAETLALLKTG